MDDIRARHRKEAKDLQAKITSKKKNASKKTRKGVNDECAALEAELKERQAAELAALDNPEETDTPNAADDEESPASNPPAKSASDPVEPLANALEKSVRFTAPDDQDEQDSPSAQAASQQPPGKKRNRQKERLARRTAEQEAVAAQAASEAASMPDLRKAERARLLEEFEKRHLSEKAVAANGHCMYSSVADQLRCLGLELRPSRAGGQSDANGTAEVGKDDYKIIRSAAADYILDNPDDFVPFLEEPLEEYVEKVRNTGEWGGQLELMALARTYMIDINVVQAEGRVERIQGQTEGSNGDEHDEREAWLAYYRHGFGLGEHYNSLRRNTTAPATSDT